MSTRVLAGPTPRPIVASLPRYSRAPATDSIRWFAASNESPLPPHESIAEAVALAGAAANRYPSLGGEGLADDIAERLGLTTDEVVVGGGSIALLQQALLAFCREGDEVVYAWRSYEAYPILAGVAGATSVPVPLTTDHRHDLDAMLAPSQQAKAVIVCNPNNPTGTQLTLAELTRFLLALPAHVLVLLDEAYFEFDDREIDGVRIFREFPNVAVFRTFSKAYALAGLRAGYMLANPEIADAVRATLLPFGVSAPAEAAARRAWASPERTVPVIRSVVVGRERLRSAIEQLGIHTPASSSNFVWLPIGQRSAELAATCAQQGVAVRAFDGEGVRVTVGSREAEDAVIAAVTAMFAPI
jgi:histidinol-phosphate aminotransferase